MTAPDPLTAYYATEYHRRNMQVARVCGAQAAVDQALERAMAIKSIPAWLIAYLESAATRLPGLQHDLAAWRDLAPDAPDAVRADLIPSAALAVPEVRALVEAANWQIKARAQHWLRRNMTAPEDAEVEALCEKYGYGAVMDAASRLWARKPYGSGAFYVGGCIGFKSDEEALAALRGEGRS